jgi:hypothetical protein
MTRGRHPDPYFRFNPQGTSKESCKCRKKTYLKARLILMRRLEKLELEKKEARDVKAAEARSTCEECGEYGHVHKDCLEKAKVLDYMRKGDLPNFRYDQGRPQFNASSSISNSVRFVYN